MNHLKLYGLLFCLILLTIFTADENFFLETDSFFSAFASKKENKLLEEIKANAYKYKVEPENAYIDKVWKKTPGRNGLAVNIEKSYDNMKKNKKFDNSLLVFDEIKPDVSLYELPASPIYRGHPEKEMVAFLINVSWGEEYIPGILKILKNENIKATFFIEGKWAKENKELVEMIYEQNHVVGNHAYNHPDMAQMNRKQIRDQIEDTNDVIEAIINERPKWFAPPSGSFNEHVIQLVEELGMETILWTVDTVDWKNPSVSVMINRVMKNIHPGAMILMHPTQSVAEGLTPLIQEIKEKDLEISTIENLLSETR